MKKDKKIRQKRREKQGIRKSESRERIDRKKRRKEEHDG